jgi:hypothetical protein
VKLEKTENNIAIVQLSRHQLVILNNALNEICNGIDLDDEFFTRIGADSEEVQLLLSEVGNTIDKLDSAKKYELLD